MQLVQLYWILEHHRACIDAKNWLMYKQKSVKSAYYNCPRGSWLIWLLSEISDEIENGDEEIHRVIKKIVKTHIREFATQEEMAILEIENKVEAFNKILEMHTEAISNYLEKDVNKRIEVRSVILSMHMEEPHEILENLANLMMKFKGILPFSADNLFAEIIRGEIDFEYFLNAIERAIPRHLRIEFGLDED